MKFIEKLKTSWSILTETIKSIKKYPILLVPIFITWLIFASLVVYLTYYFQFPNNDIAQWAIIIWLFWFISFILTYTSAIMVSLVRQIETNWKYSFKKAFKEANSKIISLAGLSFIWAILWLLLTIIEAIVKRDNNNSNSHEVSYENIAKTLWWEGSTFSWFTLGLDVLKDILRLAVFLSVPAILWENKKTFEAIKSGAKIIWKHPTEFLGIYGGMTLIVIFMVLPIAVIFWMSQAGYHFSDWIWIAVIIYEGIVWTFSIYMEQMSSTLLYLWDLKWRKINSKIENEEEKIPFNKIEKPSLLDDNYEFAN